MHILKLNSCNKA